MTTKQAPSVREVVTLLIQEVREIGQDVEGFSGASIVSIFKNVVCLELQMSIFDLPLALQVEYDKADSHRSTVYDPKEFLKTLRGLN